MDGDRKRRRYGGRSGSRRKGAQSALFVSPTAAAFESIPESASPSQSVAIRGLARPYTVQAFRALLAGAGAGELKDDAIWQNEIRTTALVTVANVDTAARLVAALTNVEFPFSSGRKLTASFSAASAAEHRAVVKSAAEEAKAAAAAAAHEEEEYIAGGDEGVDVDAGDGGGDDDAVEKRVRTEEAAGGDSVDAEPQVVALSPRDRKLASLVQQVRPEAVATTPSSRLIFFRPLLTTPPPPPRFPPSHPSCQKHRRPCVVQSTKSPSLVRLQP